jgi:hypothetical protein
MKKLLLLLIIPFLSFGQCIDGDFDNDGICDEIDDCVGTWMPDIVTGNCSQFTSQGADACNSYSGCEWTYSWGGWVTGGSSDCVGSYEVDNGYCDELELIECDLEILADYDYNGSGNWYPVSGLFNNAITMSCFGDFIFINATAAGGTAPYNFTCMNSFGVEIDLTTAFSTGDYMILVSDSEGCESYLNFLISDIPLELTASVVVMDSICNDGSGAIELTISGGTAPYALEDLYSPDFSWLESSQQNINVLAGDTITVTDANGCETIVEIICDDTAIKELDNSKTLIKAVGILGRAATNKGFQLHIYDDGSVEKKYLIK